MYVCICNAVTDRQIRAAVADGARSMRDLRRELGVCSCCGKCGPAARELLAEAAPVERRPRGFPTITVAEPAA
jgi:bacterioferritin-associated ferredoxin